MNPEWFASRLKELRTSKGMTQPELAEKAGLTKAGIANLEQGRREPSWSTVVALCHALGVKCDAFFEEPSPETEPQGRGRPKKEAAEPTEPEVKRGPGRPKKSGPK
jgi:transcriptional regulator with XRE-family HTH domain